MASDSPEPRRAVAYAARRVTLLGRMPWQGYARCTACPWWAVTSSADLAVQAAEEHRCREPRP